MKYIFWLFLLLSCRLLLAQESSVVFYDRSRLPVKIKKSGRTEKTEWITVTEAREAQLIYTPDYLLFKSPQVVDTVFLSKINKTVRGFIDGESRMFSIAYNNEVDCIILLFCKRKQARKFKRFMLDAGGHYSRDVGKNILFCSFLVLLSPIGPVNPFESLLTPSWRHWQKTCDASKK